MKLLLVNFVFPHKTSLRNIVAILHDVLEDTFVTKAYLIEEEFRDIIISAIEAITKIRYEEYNNYINRVKSNKLATTVKIADLLDNINLSRLTTISVKDINRTRKYLDALEYLIS